MVSIQKTELKTELKISIQSIEEIKKQERKKKIAVAVVVIVLLALSITVFIVANRLADRGAYYKGYYGNQMHYVYRSLSEHIARDVRLFRAIGGVLSLPAIGSLFYCVYKMVEKKSHLMTCSSKFNEE
ncbi:MAG: hypothetical protein S4CHLAM45_02790 [Chlamydiales bacterium]|nr:hypothetical protein [Chlamydiales bacterium]MCH9619137.1 hypothetical protein [Chlamydiales bacterium]MCH9622399.1 hypothetical protein [Chlamydiales bacterium]